MLIIKTVVLSKFIYFLINILRVMRDLFRVLFVALLAVITFAACSDDDSDDDGKVDNLGKIENFSVKVVESAIGQDTYEYSWKGVSGAYSYQVYYRAKGTTEWSTSNVYIPSPNTPGETMTNIMMAGYGKGVVYEMKIVSHRDTGDKITAESGIIESPELPAE